MYQKDKSPRGFIARILRSLNIEPTEALLFKIRVAIVIFAFIFITYNVFIYDSVGNEYGNYDEVKFRL